MNRFAKHQTRLDQLNFGLRAGGLFARAEPISCYQSAGVLLNLHQRIGAIDGVSQTAYEAIAAAANSGDPSTPPLRLYDGADQAPISISSLPKSGAAESFVFSVIVIPAELSSACAH